MDYFYILVVLFIIITFFIFPIVAIYFLNKWLRKKNKKLAAIAIIILLLAYSLFIYRDFYPSDKFYKNNFENNTHLKFPTSGKIVDKSASVSMFEIGGSDLCSKVELSNYDYRKIENSITHSTFTKT